MRHPQRIRNDDRSRMKFSRADSGYAAILDHDGVATVDRKEKNQRKHVSARALIWVLRVVTEPSRARIWSQIVLVAQPSISKAAERKLTGLLCATLQRPTRN